MENEGLRKILVTVLTVLTFRIWRARGRAGWFRWRPVRAYIARLETPVPRESRARQSDKMS
jgi:hypothetical protein